MIVALVSGGLGLFILGALISAKPTSPAVAVPSKPSPAEVGLSAVPIQKAELPPAPAPASQTGSGLDYLTLKAASEEHLKALLKDDHGVRYQGVQTRLSTMDGGGIVAFCGQVDAKNAFGAYAGFSRFIASPSIAIMEDQMTAADFEQAWQRFCTDGVEGPKVWF